MSKAWAKTPQGKAYHREWKRQWTEKNQERERARRKAYEAKHRERYLVLRAAWRERNLEKLRARARKRKLLAYGLGEGEYQRLFIAQNGRCAICGCEPQVKKNRSVMAVRHDFCIDHDHATGVVRGLLCTPCNLIIGNAYERGDVLERAIQYLKDVANREHQRTVEACA
jgi:hypothetical protein